ncbi:MAG: hypothetical protein ACSHX9_06340 [Luteolibacter sp.]
MKLKSTALATLTLILAFASCSTDLPGLSDQPKSAKFKPYPLETCLVTNEGLDSKGGTITRYYQGQELKICCKACENAFKANPDAFMAKLK